jgi:hypothetical protein
MEHSIFLDSEKINSIRETLEGRFNQIKVIDDSVTPIIIVWLNDFFSFHDDLKYGFFICNKNIELEQWFDYLRQSKPYLYELLDNIKELLTEEEYENYLLFVSYHKIKEDLYEKNSVLETEIINDFYFLKLPILKPILSSIIREIAVSLKNSNKYKKQFEDLKTHIEEFYFKSMSDNSAEKETKDSIIKELDWHPFSNDEVRNFYLFIEKKHGTGNKTIFGAYWKFLSDNGIVDKKVRSIKKRYVEWINLRFAFPDDKKIKILQPNSSKIFRNSLLDDLVEYEEKSGLLHNFLEDGNKKRTKKNRPTR